MAWVVAAVLAVVVLGLVVALVRQRSALAATAEISRERDQVRAAAEAADASRQAAEAKAAGVDAELRQVRSTLGTVEAGAATARHDLQAARSALDTAHQRAGSLETALQEATSARDATTSARDAAISARDAAEARVAALEPDLRAATSARETAEHNAAVSLVDLRVARSALDAAQTRIAVLETELHSARTAPPADADTILLERPAPAPVGADARLAVVWALAELAQRRAWRLSLAGPERTRTEGLAGALNMEVERIREEVGTPGSLHLVLEPEVAPTDAAVALLAARELLAALVPHTQAYDMSVGRDGGELAVRIVCTGWDGPPEAADDVSRLLAAVAPVGADLQLDEDSDGRLQATLQIPLLG